MRKNFILAIAALAMAGCVSSMSIVRVAPNPIAPDRLRANYDKIWNTAGGPRPAMIAHLGAASGNRITVWVKVAPSTFPTRRNWSITCANDPGAQIEEQITDPAFGVATVAVARSTNVHGALPCTIALAGQSASIVIPQLGKANDIFSFLAYSCSEPFAASHGGILARDVSNWWRMERRAAGEQSFDNQVPYRPEFVLGLGDQVYVDPGADKDKGVISFFGGSNSDEFRIPVDSASLYSAFNILYEYNFGLVPVAAALSKLPSFMMWDDHEIRDGWGSHGDESDTLMQRHFRVARHAFIAHQVLRSQEPDDSVTQDQYNALLSGSKPVHRRFSYGERTRFLMLDSRTTRSATTSIFDDLAKAAVQEWLASGNPNRGDLYVLTTGLPLFPSRRERLTNIGRAASQGLRDDLEDGWESESNKNERAELVGMLRAHFDRNTGDRLLVLSGDVHHSALYFLRIGERVIGQEVVTSGIAHEMPEGPKKLIYFSDAAGPVHGINVTPAGKIIDSASFAEIIVDTNPTMSAPSVKLIYHTNGYDGKLANTVLLHRDVSRPMWYYPYRFDYPDDDQNQHINNVPAGVTRAGTILTLSADTLPTLNYKRGTTTVESIIQWQSAVCEVDTAKYDRALVPKNDWTLSKLPACEPF